MGGRSRVSIGTKTYITSKKERKKSEVNKYKHRDSLYILTIRTKFDIHMLVYI